jgi:ResB-like family
MTQDLAGRKAGSDEAGSAGVAGNGAGAETAADATPAADLAPRRFGAVGWLRWIWHQLTSMRTALVLLFLLALASIPGSVLPQQGIDPAAVSQYYAAHPALAPFLAKLSGFDVFGAPWFAAQGTTPSRQAPAGRRVPDQRGARPGTCRGCRPVAPPSVQDPRRRRLGVS